MIVFDLQALQSRAHGERGIARFCLELASALEEQAPGRVDRFLLNPNLPVPAAVDRLRSTGRVAFSDELGNRRIDLLHVGSPIELDRPLTEILPVGVGALVANLYDLIPAVFPDRYLVDTNTRLRYQARLGLYGAADMVLTDSQSAADDAIELLGLSASRVRVIGAGAGAAFRPHPGGPAEALREVSAAVPGVRPGFVLVPAGIDWRKNIEGVMHAYGRLPVELRTRHQLVLACRISDHDRAALSALAASLGFEDSFVMTGFVSDAVLVAMNQATELVVFPSRYEGFGLPVLEARRCGAPVICGDNSSLREVVPDPSARFDSDDVSSIHDHLERALADRSFSQALRTAAIPNFTWEEAARRTLLAYDDLLDRRTPRSRRPLRRRSIAYVTPLPPVRSGIAEYSLRLLEELALRADVHCFVEDPGTDVRWPSGVWVNPLSDLPARWAADEFDHVIHAVGNNGIHRSAIEMLKVVGGVVHLHDVRLVNCYAESRWPDVVEAHYPGRFTEAELAEMTAFWAESVAERGVFLLADIARSAQAIFVHSHHAADLVEQDIGIRPTVVGPLGGLAPWPRRRVRASGARIVSFGIVSTAKQSDKLVRAVRRLRSERPDVELTLVGAGAEVLDTIEGGAEGVVCAGHVDDVEYERWMEWADLAVQLRDRSNGESSAAVADCLARGLPTVVTAIGSARELPNEVVAHVERDVSDEELAVSLGRLLDDDDRRQRLSDGARSYARHNTAAAAAERLLAALDALAPIDPLHEAG